MIHFPETPSPLAARLGEIEPFHVMELLKRAQALQAGGHDILHMEVGEPDFPTPEPVLAAAMEFLRKGNVKYTPALGLPALREAIAGHYARRFGVALDPQRVVVTTGSSAALMLALGLLVDPGSEVLLTDPGYPCNRHFVRALEGRSRAIPVHAAGNFQPTPQDIADNWSDKTVAALFASPANPTGTLISNADMAPLIEAVHGRGGRMIVDEIYQGLTYGSASETALALSGDLFLVNSFSKYFNMTGWRLGWLVVPSSYVREVEKLAQNLYICAPEPAQHAALAAFHDETLGMLESRRAELGRRRDYLLPALRELGFVVGAEPRGAFYIYADCSALTADSQTFAHELLERSGVAITPGIDFGDNTPERHVRFAYTCGIPRLKEGIERLRRHISRG